MKTTLKICGPLLGLVLGVFFAASPSHAAGVDQSNENADTALTFGAGGTCAAAGQSFTTGAATDNLIGVSFRMKRSGDFGGSDGLTLQIASSTSTPDTPAPYGKAYSATESNDLFPADGNFHEVEFLLDAQAPLTGGTKVWAWIVQRGSSPTVQMEYEFAGSYQGAAGQLLTPLSNCSSAWADTSSDAWFQSLTEGGLKLHYAVPLSYSDGSVGLSAKATFTGEIATTIYLTATRIDPVGHHASWSLGFGPFLNGTEIDTTEFARQNLPPGRYRVRGFAMTPDGLFLSNYIDVDLAYSPYAILTATGDPEIDFDNAVISASSTGEGYTFSASAAAIIAAGGLTIDANGCAHVPGEDATSTLCTGVSWWNSLQSQFALIGWPTSIFRAFFNAWEGVKDTEAPYSLGLPSHGDWIPAVTVVDSASSGAGIGKYIPESAQSFLRSCMTFAVWAVFVESMRRRALSLLT